MTGKLYFILGSTFLMGVIAGGYLYLTVFAPAYKSGISTSEAIDKNATVIEGRMYGGCMQSGSCASFKLVENGSYSYLRTSDAKIAKGKLRSSITDPVFEAIGTQSFLNDARENSGHACASYEDGIDYAYDVTYKGSQYTLDTCTTIFGNDSKLKSRFYSLWAALEDPEKTYPTIIEKGLSGAVEEYMKNVGK